MGISASEVRVGVGSEARKSVGIVVGVGMAVDVGALVGLTVVVGVGVLVWAEIPVVGEGSGVAAGAKTGDLVGNAWGCGAAVDVVSG